MSKTLFNFTARALRTAPLPSRKEVTFDSELDTLRNYEVIGEDVFFEILEPEDLRFTYRTHPAIDFGAPFKSGFYAHNVKLVVMDPPDGCAPSKNADFIYENVAFIERGTCTFVVKTSFAEKAGAKAVIITDNEESEFKNLEMVAGNSDLNVSIPATFLIGKNGFIIRDTLKKLNLDHALINIPVNLTNVPLNQWKQPPWLAW